MKPKRFQKRFGATAAILAALVAGAAPARADLRIIDGIDLVPGAAAKIPLRVVAAADDDAATAALKKAQAGPEQPPVPGSHLINDEDFPAGTDFQVDRDWQKKTKRMTYWDEKEHKNKEGDFVPLKDVDRKKLPPELQESTKHGDGPTFWVPRSSVEDSVGRGGQGRLGASTPYFRDDGPNAFKGSEADRREADDAYNKWVADHAGEVGGDLNNSLTQPGGNCIPSPGTSEGPSRTGQAPSSPVPGNGGGSYSSADAAAHMHDGKSLPPKAMEVAEKALAQFGRSIKNRYFIINDFTAPSNTRRMFVVDSVTHQVVDRFHVAHGSGNGRNQGLMATAFGDSPGSNLTPPGAHVTVPHHQYKGHPSFAMRGLEPRNRHSEGRGILLHYGDYSSAEAVRATGNAGLSWGCSAVGGKELNTLMGKYGINNGDPTLIYNFTPEDYKR